MVQNRTAVHAQTGAEPVDVGIDYDEAVLAVAELIPAGRVLSYGDIAELLGRGGARQVGKVMSTSGSSVSWWRVIRAAGTLPADLQAQAESYWEAEGTARRASTVDMRVARWMPDEAAHHLIEAIAQRLPEPKSPVPGGQH